MCSRLYSRDDGQEALLDHLVFLRHLRPLIGGAELDEVLRFGQLTFVDGQEGLIGPKVGASQTFVGIRYRFCRIGSEPGDEQADGQETANAMESAWRASLIAGSNRGPKRGFGGMLPRLVSRFPATAAEGGCMPPWNLMLSCT
jgi:hypothetical protein